MLYFSTALPLRDTGAPHQGRIYRWDAARGVQVYAERNCRIHEGGGAFRILLANVPLDGPL